MDWKIFGTAFVTLLLAELGEKTRNNYYDGEERLQGRRLSRRESSARVGNAAGRSVWRASQPIHPDRVAPAHRRSRVIVIGVLMCGGMDVGGGRWS